MNSALALSLVALSASACAAAPPGDEILAADADRRAAQVAANPEALDRILHERLRYRHSDGREETKAELIASLTGGAVDYREIRVRRVQVIGCVARTLGCVRALQTLEVFFEGRDYTFPGCYVAAYECERGQLRLVDYRSSALDPAGACPL